jgi:hypothetical protein
MCNCNQKRTQYTSENNEIQKETVKVMLIGNTPMVINGDITGRMYVFRNKNDINWVDKRDVITMKGIDGLQIFY